MLVRNLGIAALIAEAINGLFFRELECPGIAGTFGEGQSVEISLDGFTLHNPGLALSLNARPVPSMLLEPMLPGGLYPYLEGQGLLVSRTAGGASGIG
jgi:3-isopropylmalate/(R)-2-methylmalate dehydratase small subunit